MKRKVLIISYSYPPSNAPAAQRPYAVAKYLDNSKFEVTVITCSNADVSLGVNTGFDEQLPEVNLIKVDSLLGGGALALRKSRFTQKKSLKTSLKSRLFGLMSSMVVPDKAVFWFPRVRRYLLNHQDLINNSDVVYTTSPLFSNHLVGQFIKSRNKNISWIAELRDFHFIETAAGPLNPKQYINERLEQLVIKKADRLSFISYAMKEIYAAHFAAFQNKFGVIYNGFDLADFERLTIAPTTNEKLTIFYAGTFYGGVRSPVPLLAILDRLIEQGVIATDEIEIRIAGSLENELIEQLQTFRSYVSINLIGNIPRAEVLKHLVTSDLLWLIVGHKSTHYTGVPIKFFEYLGARRPIVNFAPAASEATRIIAKHRLGWNIDTTPFDLERAADTFREIIENFRSRELSNSLEDQFLPQFDRQYQGGLFAELFMERLSI